LRGLSPEQAFKVWEGRRGGRGERLELLKTAYDLPAKQATTEYTRALTRQITPDKPYTLPDGTSVTLTQPQIGAIAKAAATDPNSKKEYNIYAREAIASGTPRDQIMSYADFLVSDYQDYMAAVRDGYKGKYTKWKKEIRRSGATRITLGERIEQRKAFADVDSISYLKSAKFRVDAEKAVADKKGLFMFEDDVGAAYRDTIIDEMETRLKASAAVKSFKPEKRGDEFGWEITTTDDEKIWLRFE